MVPPEAERKNPFETVQLTERRWEQRRLLRLIFDELLEAAITQFRVFERELPSEEDRRALLEGELREIADRVRREHEQTFDLLTKSERSNALVQFFPEAYRSKPGSLKPFVSEAWNTFETPDLENPELEAALTVVALLVWTDELANDGYRDPRVTGP